MKRPNTKITVILAVFLVLTVISAYERAINATNVMVQEWGFALLIFITADILAFMKMIFSD